MIVGFMRNFIKPPEMAFLTAKMSKYYGIDIIYLTPKEIDIENNKVKGRVLVGEEWIATETDLPKLIDISPYCFKKRNMKITNYLRKNTYLTDNRKNLINKVQLQEKLKEDPSFSRYVIPTMRIETIDDIYNGLSHYSNVVLKPIGGERGKGIYIISKEGRKFKVGYQKEEDIISKKNLGELFLDKLSKGYILQKYICSRSLNGDPFDCRIHFEKNGQGKWEVAKMYIRIGIGQKVISNMNQGGGMANPKNYLKANFPDNWKEIHQSLLKLSKVFPYKFEQLRKTEIMSLGIDVGIDRDGKIYIFEANGAPATSALKAEVVNLRTQYYHFLINNKLNS